MRWKLVLLGVVLIVVGVGVWFITLVDRVVPVRDDVDVSLFGLAESPYAATYRLDETEVTLTEGVFSAPAAPDSAAMTTVRLQGEPVWADVNVDGTEDAVVLLTYEGGGSGTFWYLAAAVYDRSGFRGTNAIPLGDRVVPEEVYLWQDLLVVRYRAHAVEQSLAEDPTQETERYFIVHGARIEEVGPLGAGEEVVQALLDTQGEDLYFTTCRGGRYRVAASSPALTALRSVHELRSAAVRDGQERVLVVLAGSRGDTVSTEEGVEEVSFTVERVMSAPLGGVCVPLRNESESVDGEQAVPAESAEVQPELED